MGCKQPLLYNGPSDLLEQCLMDCVHLRRHARLDFGLGRGVGAAHKSRVPGACNDGLIDVECLAAGGGIFDF